MIKKREGKDGGEKRRAGGGEFAEGIEKKYKRGGGGAPKKPMNPNPLSKKPTNPNPLLKEIDQS
jgi:hypothetical protein